MSGPATFTWTLAAPTNAFGFYTHDHDSISGTGTISIGFMDGSQQSYSYVAGGNNNVDFWGIAGLTSLISSVTLSTTDTTRTEWDEFVYAEVVVPVPAGLPLLATGLGLLALMRRRQGRAV